MNNGSIDSLHRDLNIEFGVESKEFHHHISMENRLYWLPSEVGVGENYLKSLKKETKLYILMFTMR